MKKKISCIIPAYNEAKRIKNVLDVVLNHPLIDEIVVINDGSTDDTEKILKNITGIKLISYKKNKGKSYAIMKGFKETRNNLIILLDSDLLGLTTNDISNLIKPILENKADISISLRINSPKFWRLIGIDYISGERVFNKKLIDDFSKIKKLPGFGLEVFFNKYIIKNNLRIKIVKWNNVKSPYKISKDGFFKGIKGDIKMMYQIFKTIGLHGTLYQIYKMRKQRI